MKNIVTLDNKAIADWAKPFKLSYDWINNSPSLIAATLALSTLAKVTPPGYYLAKLELKVEKLPPLNQELILGGEIIKKSKLRLDYMVCQSTITCRGKTIISLRATLIIPKTEPAGTAQKINTYKLNDTGYWHTFTLDEVNTFASLSGDTNDIHTGVRPVVQGMLILLALEDYLAQNNRFLGSVDVQFLNPVIVNESVKLYKQDKILYGIVDEKVCFKLNFQEGKDVYKN